MADRPREPAICVQASDFSETSQVAQFLTRGCGIVHVLAKGSKRAKSPTGGRLDLLAEGELVFIPPRREGLGTLVEFTPATLHSPLRRRLAELNAALYMVEIVRMLLAEADPHPRAFDLLSAALGRLEREDAPVQAVLAYFQWRLLSQVGLLGEMSVCVGCGGQVGRRAQFTSKEGGLLCRNCEGSWTEKRLVGPNALAGIQALRAMNAGSPRRVVLTEVQAAAVNELLGYHIGYQAGRPPRMLRHVRPAKPGA